MRLRDLLKAAREQGWRVEDITDGHMLYPPDTALTPVTLHRSTVEGASRAHANLLADLRRRGMAIPGEEHRKATRRLGRVSESDELVPSGTYESDDDMNLANGADPLSALQAEAQVEETVEVTRRRRVKIWGPTLEKLIRAYVQMQVPIPEDSLCDIDVLIDDKATGKQIVAPLDKVVSIDVCVTTIEKQETRGA